MSATKRNPNSSPEGREANRPPVRYGAPAAAVLRAQTAAPSYSSASVASVRSAMLPGNARDALDPAGNRGGTKPDSVSVAPLAVRHSDQATLRVGMRLASVQAKAQRSLGGVSSEPCDRVGQRSARRLTLIIHRTQAHGVSDNPSLLSLLGVAVVGIVTFLALFGW